MAEAKEALAVKAVKLEQLTTKELSLLSAKFRSLRQKQYSTESGISVFSPPEVFDLAILGQFEAHKLLEPGISKNEINAHTQEIRTEWERNINKEGWPFPMPAVATKGWSFDTKTLTYRYQYGDYGFKPFDLSGVLQRAKQLETEPGRRV